MDDVQPFAFGRGEAQPRFMLSGLDRLAEKLGRRLRSVFEPLMGVKPEVTLTPVDLLEFEAWSDKLPASASISAYRLAPLKGHALLRLDAEMISVIVDRFYGGSGNRALPFRGEFTPTEDRMIARLADTTMAALADCWSTIFALDAALVSRETGIGPSAGFQPSDQVVLQRYTIEVPREDKWTLDILIPLAALRNVEPLSGSTVHEHPEEADALWQTRLARQMDHIRLPARTVLARPNLSLAELMQLQPGDVIPVHIARSLPLIVGDRIVAHGSIGEQDGRAAFLIEKLN